MRWLSVRTNADFSAGRLSEAGKASGLNHAAELVKSVLIAFAARSIRHH